MASTIRWQRKMCSQKNNVRSALNIFCKNIFLKQSGRRACLIVWFLLTILLLYTVSSFVSKYVEELVKPKQRSEMDKNGQQSPNGETENVVGLACKVQKHFVFVKTHKTGGSTIRDMMNHFISKHNLLKIPCARHASVGGYPGKIQTRFMLEHVDGKWRKLSEVGKTNAVIANHARFDAQVIRKVMPQDVKIFTIIRRPWSQFQSAYHFYYGESYRLTGLQPYCFNDPFFQISRGKTISVLDYLIEAESLLNSSVPWFFKSTNYQSHDLGLDPTLTDDEEIRNAIEKLSQELDLVMITEYFEESLILLKDLLCMDWTDLIYEIKRKQDYKKYFPEDNPRSWEAFKKFHKVDFALYEHFSKTFWEKVIEYGRERMVEDVQKLRQLIARRKDRSAEGNGSFNKLDSTVTSATENDRLVDLKKPSVDVELNTTSLKVTSIFASVGDVKDLVAYMTENHGECKV